MEGCGLLNVGYVLLTIYTIMTVLLKSEKKLQNDTQSNHNIWHIRWKIG